MVDIIEWFAILLVGLIVTHYLSLCSHKWKTIKDEPIISEADEHGGVRKGTRYHLRCSECGEVTKRDII